MGEGARYQHVVEILKRNYRGGSVLEIGAGGAVYRDLFDSYTGLDLPSTPYAGGGDIGVFGDGGNLPFKPESFDLIFMVATLYLVTPDPMQVCQEVWMSLKTNGRLLVFDYTEGVKIKAQINNLAKGQKRKFHFWSGKELKRLLAQTGFVHIRQFHRGFLEAVFFQLLPGLADKKGSWLIYCGEKE